MSRTLPPLTWFRTFEAAARKLSFTAAAEEIGMTQSAVSQQVRALETRLGIELFVRKPRGLALTDDGRKLLPKVAAALGVLSQAVEGFEPGSARNLLTIASSVSVGQWLLAPRLAAFQARHPDLRLRVMSTIWPDDFRAALADVEIRFGSAAQVGQGAERLGPDALIAVASEDRVQDWRAGPFIEAVGTSQGWTDWALAAGEPGLAGPKLFVDNYGLALDLAAQGAGVALTSKYLAAQAVRTDQVRQVDPCEIDSSEGYFLAYDTGSQISRDFVAWFTAE